ncbi:MAG: hypothetical protein ABIW76_08430 [Fibrobacteria bacterium]
MKNFIKITGVILALGLSAHAQVTQAELQTIKMWPSGGKWLASKVFNYPGDYGYYLDNNPMVENTGPFVDLADWRWVYYSGLTGKRVIAYGTWGQPAVGPPTRNASGQITADNCGHVVSSYGVWLQYGYYSGGQYYTGWVGPWGGSKSGTRVNDNYCKMTTTPTFHPEERYGWGQEQFDFQVPKTGNIWIGMIVGATAVSHARLGCSSFACVNQPSIVAYTLNY